MAKQILFNEEANQAMLAGMNKLAKSVVTTFGPKGRNTGFSQKYDVPLVTNDGYTIAKQIELEDKFENLGATILKEASLKSNETSGDGTTAAVVLAQAIINESHKNIASGANPVFIKKGIQMACNLVTEILEKNALKNTDSKITEQIATISGNNDSEIGRIVSEALREVGADGVVFIEDTQKTDTVLNTTHGVKLDSGYLSRFFITDEIKKVGEYKNPYILVCKEEIQYIPQIYKCLEDAVNHDASLLIIAKKIEGEALAALAANAEKGVLKVAAIRCPGHGETRDRNLDAIAAVTGAVLVDPALDMDISKCGLEVCGRASKVIIGKDDTVIKDPVEADSEEVKRQRSIVKEKLKTEKHLFEIDKLKSTLAILDSSMAVISVGGLSELEMFERKYRFEDALNAAQKAMREGVLPGGGKALLLCEDGLKDLESSLSGDEKTGVRIIRKAIEAPIRQIAENAGIDGSIVVNKVREKGEITYGYDALNDCYGDMFELGIIDPLSVVRNSFVNAVSVSSTYITTAAVVSNKE